MAEATAKTDPTIALNAVNELRKKRISEEKYKDKSGLSGDELLEFVRNERRRELCFEGHRWFDLRRYGMPSFTRVWKEGVWQQNGLQWRKRMLLIHYLFLKK